MSDSSSDGPDTRRALLAVLCVLGLVAGSAAAPALAGDAPLGGLDSPTAPAEVPTILRHFDGIRERLTGDQSSTTGAEQSLFGSLSPGDSTDVGGPVSQQAQRDSSSVHFVATASESTYWRTGAYTEYTGSGWERSPVTPLRSPGTTAVRPEQVEWSRVHLRQPATALPAPWKPVDLQYGDGEDPLTNRFDMTDTGGLRAENPLEAGSSYRVQHVKPPSDPATLRQTRLSGTKVDESYTDVKTTDRVRELSDRVVGDAGNRYDAATAVETYLESEKTYSLTDVPEPDDQLADQFLFEQEQGYCEYYATSMTVMLRSQGVPARYVVGYSEGEQVAQNRYVVRGADAHAWVEVYFEHVGWVRFDPTPSAPRQAADDRLTADSPTYQISLNGTAVPGDEVTATVEAGGLAAPNVAVSVNGEQVGVTKFDGNVSFTVPYANSLELTARPSKNTLVVNLSNSNTSAAAMPDGAAAYAVKPPSIPPPNAGSTDTQFRGDSPARSAPAVAQPGNESNGTTVEFGVLSNVRFEFAGDVEPGETVPLEVRLNGEPFANASVSVAGVDQGRTGADGTIAVEMPADASGVVEITATRADLSQTTTYPIDDLVVTTSPSLVAPLPWTEATARVTSGGEPVRSAAVSVNGERVGTTDADGRVTFDVPFGRTPALSATASDKQTVTYVDWVLPSFALVAGVVSSAAGALGLFARRRGVTVDRIVAVATRVAREATSRTVQALVATADALDELAAEFREATQDGWRGVLAWLASLPGRLSAPPIRAWAVTLLAVVRSASGGDQARQNRGRADESLTEAGGEAAGEDELSRLQSVWQRFVAVVGVERWETKTPGEVARSAVRKGFPKRPVYALTNAFRAAAYGGRTESSRVERARNALAALRSDGDAPETDGGEQ
jgi:transglutaminase-like putative cysteine protease